MNIKKKNLRKTGIILHLSALPSRWGIGDLGGYAYDFVDFMAVSGVKIWQILPLTPTGKDGSPYNSYSAFAGNEIFINIDELQGMGLLPNFIKPADFDDSRVNYEAVIDFKAKLLEAAAKKFYLLQSQYPDFASFKEKNGFWLDDFVLFKALSDKFHGLPWNEWPKEFRLRERSALKEFAEKQRELIFRYQFAQWVFFSQWRRLKLYANDKGIEIIGDIPIFISFNSSDVWANQHIFKMVDGKPSEVSGVPPDYFSKNGQLWGNPLYDWDVLKRDDFAWWVNRFKQNLLLYDLVRLDHFRAWSEYWAVDVKETTAKNGKWEACPGEEFFKLLFKKLGNFSVIAEDLGNIDEKVIKLRETFKFAGMKVLQFAFYDGTDHEFLPHNFTDANCVVYTGTHDNDTTTGWYWSLNDETKSFVNHYLETDGKDINWKMIRLALSSIATKAIFPLQDLLGFGNDCRFNTPGTTSRKNWTWRFKAGDLSSFHADKLRGIIIAYNRI